MIRRELAPGQEARLLEVLRDERSLLGVDARWAPRRELLELPGAGRPVLVQAEDSGSTWVVRRRPAWLEGKRVSFGEVLPLAGPVEGVAPADPRDEEAVLWSLTTPERWEQLELELGFELVRTPLQLVARPADVRRDALPGLELQEARVFPTEVEGLAQRLAAECGALLVRDPAWLDWRFGHADGGHRIVTARRAGHLVGCAVFRHGAFDGTVDQGLVVEWLVPSEEQDAGRALRAALAEHARQQGIERLVAVIPEWTEEWMRFQLDGFHAEPTRYVLCSRSRQRRQDAFWLFKRWYTTLADGGLA